MPVTTALLGIAVADVQLEKEHASSSLKALLLLLGQIAMHLVVLSSPVRDRTLWQKYLTDRDFASLSELRCVPDRLREGSDTPA